MPADLADLIRERIARDGPLPFGAFMSLALYHPDLGYYSSGMRRTGWAGHYVTSPELDPAFGELWAEAFAQIWIACGRPDRFRIVEVGPGEGSFAAAVLAAAEPAFADALSYVFVERVPAASARQRELLGGDRRVSWAGSLDELSTVPAGVVFANEVLDNLPVHLVERREGRLLEVCVETTAEGLALSTREPAGDELARFLSRHGMEVPDGHRMEVALSTESFVGRAARAVESGVVVLIDYGMGARELSERPKGTLVCYSATGTDDDPLERVGEKDITVHANWTVVGDALRAEGMRVIGPRMQRQVLRALGLIELDDRLRAEHQTALDAKQGARALRALSRRQALSALADPGGLGGLAVVVGTRGIDVPGFLK